MDIDALRRFCLEFPHTTENIQWGYDLCFKVDGKLFAITPLEPAAVRLSFKCSPETFSELCERAGVRPAPYMARAQWVALEQLDTLPDSELRELLAGSYRLVWERLPKKRQQELTSRKGKSPVAKRVSAKPVKKSNAKPVKKVSAKAIEKSKAKRAKAGK